MRSRIVVILIALCGLWALMIGRAAWLQIIPNKKLASLERRQFETIVELRSRRGDVLDRNGHELAASIAAFSLFADPKLIQDPHGVARALGEELGHPAKHVLTKLRGRKRRFVWVQRWLDRSTRDAVDARLTTLGERKAFGFLEESRRIYPNEKLLANAIGFVGSEGAGLEGLESRYEDELQGTNKKVSVRKDARGRPLIVNGQVFSEAPDGADLLLTIDRELQFVLEQELQAAVEQHRADSATGVVLDPQTSEVLAMASVPTFDPNKPSRFPPDSRRNRAIADAFEPGSVMKTFAIAGSLERKLLEPNTRFNCEGGSMRVDDRIVREANANEKFGMLTATEILAYSSNVGATKIGLALGANGLRDALEGFGFGARTGVDLPGESKGILQPLPWRNHLTANVSFGHGVAATALQVANAYAAIANGGWLKRPYIVKGLRDHETGEISEKKPQTLRRAISEEHLAKLRLMLMATTAKDGTGWNARVAGFPVAGKTGTAQKVDPNGRGYLKDAYISSFAGFLPANDPKFVIFVAVDNPRSAYYGSQVAAPIFAHVAKFAVRRASLSPVLISSDNLVPRALDDAPLAARPTLAEFENLPRVAKSISEHARGEPENFGVGLLRALGATPQTVTGPGEASGDAKPVAGDARPWESVPDLTGLSVREVLSRLNGAEVAIQIRGRGYVSRTSPPAGARLEAKTANPKAARHIVIYLSNEDN